MIFSSASFLDCATAEDVSVDDVVGIVVVAPIVAAVPVGSDFTPGAKTFAGGVLTVPGGCWIGVDLTVAAAIAAGIATGNAAARDGGAAAMGRVFGAIAVGFGDAVVVEVTAPAVMPIVLAANGLPTVSSDVDVDTAEASGSGFTALKAPYMTN